MIQRDRNKILVSLLVNYLLNVSKLLRSWKALVGRQKAIDHSGESFMLTSTTIS